MSSITVSCVVFACVFSGALLAMFVGRALPDHHLSGDAKDVIKLGMALIATLSALVLGLLIATAKGTFDTQSGAIKQISANVILLDRVLALYGPETKEARELLPPLRRPHVGSHLARKRLPTCEPGALRRDAIRDGSFL